MVVVICLINDVCLECWFSDMELWVDWVVLGGFVLEVEVCLVFIVFYWLLVLLLWLFFGGGLDCFLFLFFVWFLKKVELLVIIFVGFLMFVLLKEICFIGFCFLWMIFVCSLVIVIELLLFIEVFFGNCFLIVNFFVIRFEVGCWFFFFVLEFFVFIWFGLLVLCIFLVFNCL